MDSVLVYRFVVTSRRIRIFKEFRMIKEQESLHIATKILFAFFLYGTCSLDNIPFLLSAECVALAGSPSIVSGGNWWTSPASVLVQPDPITSSALQLSLNTLIDFLSHCMDPVVRVTGQCIKRKTFDWYCSLNLSSS